MYTKLMTVMTIATLACGYTFAEEDAAIVNPAVEEEAVQAPLACYADKKVAPEAVTEEGKTEEAKALACPCRKKSSTKTNTEVSCKKCGNPNHRLAVDETEAKVDATEEVEETLAACPYKKKKSEEQPEEQTPALASDAQSDEQEAEEVEEELVA